MESQIKTANVSETNLKEIMLHVDDTRIFEMEFSDSLSDLPIFCFKDSNSSSSIENLNFNELKKCNWSEDFKYMVVFLEKLNYKEISSSVFEKKFDEWHNKNTSVKIQFSFTNNNTIKFEGKMLKIFHKQYQPNIT